MLSFGTARIPRLVVIILLHVQHVVVGGVVLGVLSFLSLLARFLATVGLLNRVTHEHLPAPVLRRVIKVVIVDPCHSAHGTTGYTTGLDKSTRLTISSEIAVVRSRTTSDHDSVLGLDG